jgi:hypothetical protein
MRKARCTGDAGHNIGQPGSGQDRHPVPARLAVQRDRVAVAIKV